jgi:hypothetical protein
MEALKYMLLSVAGTFVVVASGSLWWLVPALGYAALIVYDHTTPEEARPALLQAGGVRHYLAAQGAALRERAAQPRQLTAERPERRPVAVTPGMVIRPATLAAAATSQQAQAAAPARPRSATPAAAPVLERPRWLQTINDDPDRAPHAIIIGPTGAGKTTMACAALGERPDRTVVISPKVNAGNWRGAEVVTLDDDGTYLPIRQALKDLEQEKRDRIVTLRKRGAEALDPLTVVMDETPELVRFAPEAGGFLGSMSSIGRELKIRLVVLSTSSRVKDLGIEGRGAALDNFVRVDLDRDRRAVLNDGIRQIAVPTTEIVSRAKAARLRPWRGVDPEPATVAPAAPAPDDLLAQLMAADVPPSRQSVTLHDDGRQIVVNVNQQQAAAPSRATATGRKHRGLSAAQRRLRADEYRAVRQIIAAGGSANDAQREVGINRERALKHAKQARGELGMPGSKRPS